MAFLTEEDKQKMKKYVVLERVRDGHCVYSPNQIGKDMALDDNGEHVNQIVGYTDTTEEANAMMRRRRDLGMGMPRMDDRTLLPAKNLTQPKNFGVRPGRNIHDLVTKALKERRGESYELKGWHCTKCGIYEAFEPSCTSCKNC